jgi:hypothetical protein
MTSADTITEGIAAAARALFKSFLEGLLSVP